jgi:hypothetical protein
MTAHDSEINRDIDTAEGHVYFDGETIADDGVYAAVHDLDALDDVAEGHLVRFVGDAEDAVY